MSSNGEKGMMKRSDFAQKLLDDLRVRKERLSISQDTDNYAYSNRVFKGSRERRTKSTTFEEFNYGGDKSLTSGTEVSNQILPYGKGRSIDLSKALAFALENAGKATRADPSGNASVISFLHEVGKRSLGLGTSSERRSSQQQICSSSRQQLPMVHVHIKEISKGAQKLNQIIKACSNGLSFRKGRYSLQYGEEQHMEGAIELEESLRLLVDIQQASSEYLTKNQSQNRFKLLEENDDEEEEQEQEDVRNQNNRKIKETAKADIEMRLLALNSKHRRQTSSCEDKPQKGRIPNVVAKLMGIGEFPEEDKETNKNNNDAPSIKYAESLTRRIANENIVELKDQRSSTSLELVFHKETQRTNNGINYKEKSQHKDDLNIRKGNKKDGETTTKNAIRRNSSSPTEDKPKAVTRSQEKPLHKLSFGKKLDEAKSIKKAKLKPERHQEHGVVTNHPPKPLSSVPVTDKSKAPRKSFSHVVVLEKKKGGEVHEAEFREKKNQVNSNLNGGFCKVRKQPENQKPVSKEANGKHDQLLRSCNDSNKTKAVEAERCINTSEMVQSSNRNVLEQKKDIKDDSILLIAAERVLRQAPSENHHELMFTDVVDQQAPISNSDGNSERFSKAVYKASEGEVEAGIPLLEKRQEDQKQDTKDTLSENEMNLKKIVVKSQLFLDTFEALFKLNIPLSVLREVGGNNYYQEDKNLLLDCGYEIMKRKGRFQELSVHPFVKVAISSSKVNSLDHIVRQLSKEFEKLRTYGRECYTESLVQDYLPKVLERDVHHKDPNLNSMWDMGWNDSMNAFIEKDDVIRDVEREVFNGLLEEITRDLICI